MCATMQYQLVPRRLGRPAHVTLFVLCFPSRLADHPLLRFRVMCHRGFDEGERERKRGKQKSAPTKGIEPLTNRLRAERSTS